jgi:hypothetical protein
MNTICVISQPGATPPELRQALADLQTADRQYEELYLAPARNGATAPLGLESWLSIHAWFGRLPRSAVPRAIARDILAREDAVFGDLEVDDEGLRAISRPILLSIAGGTR